VSGQRTLGDLPAACGGTFPAGVDAGDPRRRHTGTGSAGGRCAGVAGTNARLRWTGMKKEALRKEGKSLGGGGCERR
jgi:hypothetical protein